MQLLSSANPPMSLRVRGGQVYSNRAPAHVPRPALEPRPLVHVLTADCLSFGRRVEPSAWRTGSSGAARGVDICTDASFLAATASAAAVAFAAAAAAAITAAATPAALAALAPPPPSP